MLSATVTPRRPVRLPAKPAYLAGRDDLLREMRERLRDGEASGPRIVWLSGIGGIGKTSLALAYAHRHLGDYGLAWHLPADDPAALGTAFAQLAEQLGVGDQQVSPADAVQQVFSALAARPDRWLLVFDNATDPVLIRRYLPSAGDGEIIVTSQDARWPAAQLLDVPVIGAEDAAEFLMLRSEDSDAQGAARLAEQLGHLPLALEQAGAYCRATGVRLVDYEQLFLDSREELLTRSQPIDYDHTVATTWLVAFARLSDTTPTAITLLRVLALYAPAPIPIRLLIAPGAGPLTEVEPTLAGEIESFLASKLAINDAIAALHRYSLLTRLSPDFVEMHRLVRAVTIDQIPRVERRAWAEAAAALLMLALPAEPEDPEAWALYELLTPHALCVLPAKGLSRIFRYLLSVGRNDVAVVVQEHICEQTLDLVGDQHPKFVIEMGNLFYAIGANGDYAQARDGFAGLLHGVEGAASPTDRFILVARAHHARWTGAAGDPAEACRLFAKLIPIMDKALGPKDASTALARFNHASMMIANDDPAGARSLYEQMLPEYQERLGPTHPDTLGLRSNHAYAVGAAGQPDVARELYAKLIPLAEAILGPDHPDVLGDRSNSAFFAMESGDLTTAHTELGELLPRFEKVLGSEHPHTVALRRLLEKLRPQGGEEHSASQ